MPARIIVNNVWSRIGGLADISLVDELDRQLSFLVEGYQYMRAYKQGWYDKESGQWRHWDGRRHLLSQNMVFPTGLLGRVLRFLDASKTPYEIEDQRAAVVRGERFDILNRKPWPHQSAAVEAAISAGRGIIRIGTGGGKCLGFGTPVLKFDGHICPVEQIQIGDLLMGPDGQPRRVLSVARGQGPLFRINPHRGTPWICNDVHMLTLVHTVTGETIDIPLNQYVKKNKKFKHLYKQFGVGVDFVPLKTALPIDPYFLGVWFGDGTKQLCSFADGTKAIAKIQVATMDPEIEQVIRTTALEYEATVSVHDLDRCPLYSIVTERGQPNPLLARMRQTVGPEVSIPHEYLISSRKDRRAFLAGWIDTDGHFHNNSYEIVQKRADYAMAICHLARSLGLRVLVGKKTVEGCFYFRLTISGDFSEIPIRISRKHPRLRRQKKNALRTGFSVDPLGSGPYAGFELDGDGRFLLGDFTVTHNTTVAAMLAAEYNVPTMIYVVGKDLLYQFHKEMRKALGEDDVGIVGDGYCDVRKFTVCSVWTATTAFGLKSHVSLDDEDWAPEVVSMGPKKKRAIQAAVENANLAIFDEAHFLACETIQAIFKASKRCRYMFGMTGTDWRDDGADLLLEASCGGRIYNMPASKLIELGYLVTPKIALMEVPPLDEPCPNNWGAVYSRYVTHNDVRNQLVADGARKLVEMGRKTLILVRYLPHGQKLVDMLADLPVFFVNGKIEGSVRQEVKERFERGELRCLVASSVFDIGVDIPSLDALVLAGGGKSTVRVLQRIGRVIRASKGKTDAIVMDFIDNAKYLDKHSAIRIAVYETEPSFRVKFPREFDRESLKKIRRLKAKIG